MKRFVGVSKFLEWFCKLVVIPVAMFGFIYKWTTISLVDFNNKCSFDIGVGYFFDATGGSTDSLINISAPLISKLLGALLESISLVLFLIGFFYFVRVLKLYQNGKIFSHGSFLIFKKIAWVALVWTIYAPVKHMLMSVIMTMFNPVGERMISLGFNTTDMVNIFLVGLLYFITAMIYEGYTLKSESDLTV